MVRIEFQQEILLHDEWILRKLWNLRLAASIFNSHMANCIANKISFEVGEPSFVLPGHHPNQRIRVPNTTKGKLCAAK